GLGTGGPVALRVGASVVAAFERLLLVHELAGCDAHLAAPGGDPHRGGGAAAAEGGEGLAHGLGVADRLKGVVDALPVCQLFDALDQVVRLGVHDVGGAEVHGRLQLGVDHVGGDDRVGPDQAAAHEPVEADATGADP